ncbi:MAG: sigma-70 family RNA polymerase sigma factor [Planctomycetota bacterium]|nr:sigma-70 family RNA polymerase sigma factor [Planctomycetota bacterium]MDG2143244.1 sigma-70 family RNA polymerase sigma factor [Planctomycetota bacterium]
MAQPLMQPAASTDTDLVAETLAGQQLSFQLLVERHQGRLFAVVRNYTRNRVEVEDIVQDAFLKAFKRLDSFQHQASFSTWLQRIAINTALDFIKRCGRSPITAVDDPEIIAERVPQVLAPGARLEREEIAEITHTVLDELPEIFRTVIIMRELEDRTYQEIADLLEISIGTVESRLYRARARFKDALLRLHPEFGEQA